MTVHCAGIDVVVGPHVRQRCAWCGLVLLDQDASRIGMPTEDYERAMEGVDPDDGNAVARALVKTWPVGVLLEVNGGNPRVSSVVEGDRFGEDSCMALDPAVTL